MTPLIDKAKVATRLQVAMGYDATEFLVFCREAQLFDLKDLLEEGFYHDLVANFNTAPYTTILAGGSYTYDGRSIEFPGLEEVLCYYAYARFILNSPVVSTSHGVTTKTTPFSQPVPLEERRNIYYKKREEAGALFDTVRLYAERNLTLYPSWQNSTSCGASGSWNGSTRVIQ